MSLVEPGRRWGEYAGSVAVHADYTFVHPVTPARGSTEVTRTTVRRVLDVQLSDPSRHDVPPGRLLIIRNASEFSNSACDVYDGFLHPEFATTEPTTDPYDRSRDVPADGEGCRVVSRT